jgi:hypothetical protein
LSIPLVLCLGSSRVFQLVYREELAALGQQCVDAEQAINAKTHLHAHVLPSFQSSFVTGLSTIGIAVQFDFVPPTADPAKLDADVKSLVREHVKNVAVVQVVGLPVVPGRR